MLIPEARLHDARRGLAALDFQCSHHPDWVQPYLRFGHELDFTSRDGGFQIDLQWRFAKKWLAFPLDPAAVWPRTVFTSIGATAVRQPSVEDSMLILCGHGYRHCWSVLKWIRDVSAFVHVFSDLGSSGGS